MNEWSCPSCRRKFIIPAGAEPHLCPSCASASLSLGQWYPCHRTVDRLRNMIRTRPLTHVAALCIAFVMILSVRSPKDAHAPLPIVAEHVLSASDVYSRIAPCIVSLEAVSVSGDLLQSGSGIVISSDVIVSNAHVCAVPSTETLFVRESSGEESSVETLTRLDSEKDFARFALRGAPPKIALNATLPKVGEKVYAIGDSMGLPRTFSEGIVSGIRKHNQMDFLQFTAAVSPGSSGGALVNEKGELVGMICSGLPEGQSIGFAVSTADLMRFVVQPEQESSVKVAAVQTEAIPEAKSLKWGDALKGIKECTFDPTPNVPHFSGEDMLPIVKRGLMACGIELKQQRTAPRSCTLRALIIHFRLPNGDLGCAVRAEMIEAVGILITEDPSAGSATTWNTDFFTGICKNGSENVMLEYALTAAMTEFVSSYRAANGN